MDDIFGRVTAILVAAFIFAGMPLIYMSERAKTAEQMYLLSANTEFVDSLCNRAVLTKDLYQQFCREISAAPGIYEIHMVREQKELVLDEGKYSYVSKFYDESDMLEQILKGSDYQFDRGDYVKVSIIKKNHQTVFPWLKDDTVNVFYGGTVRYEDF